uniref:Uncharacterized protein n=1 Tax=Anguilla anguilla TaxID=7936 RepID=A0A0E9P5L7_ANGAN
MWYVQYTGNLSVYLNGNLCGLSPLFSLHFNQGFNSTSSM